jgi:hypothetical protein
LNLGHGIPQDPSEIAPDTLIHDATEGDFLNPLTGRIRRMRFVRIVARDQNRLYTVQRDMGPATGEDGVLIPGDETVEMAHVHDLLDTAMENRRRRAAKRKLWLPERHKELQGQLVRAAEMAIASRKGRQF